MPSNRQLRHKSSSDESSPSSASGPSTATSISFSHFTDPQSIQPSRPLKQEANPESEFKVSFQFVGNQDARKATTENRSHVMREYRRKQRWEQEQKKKRQEAEKKKAAAMAIIGSDTDEVKLEATDLANTLVLGKLVQSLKRKQGFEPTENETVMLTNFEHETNHLATLIMSQMSAPIANTQPSIQGPVLDVFTERFVDSFAPQARNAGSATTIRSIATVREFSPLLKDAFNAVSTTFAGQCMDDRQIVIAGHGVYTAVLKSLQEALAHPVYSRSESVLSTVVLCIAFESMRHTTPAALAQHCQGALQLIEYRGPHAHVSGLEHLCFAEMRPYWAFAAIVFRKPTFLSEARWKTIPWSSPETTKDIMSHLLDHVCDVPSILYQFDMLKVMKDSNDYDQSNIKELQNTLWHDTERLHKALLDWKAGHADLYPTGQPEIAVGPLAGTEPFPVFHTRNPRTGDISTPPLITYPDPDLARTLCTYYATLIVLGSVDTRTPYCSYNRGISPLEIFGFAMTILRSVEYYLRNVPGNMANRIMYPLRAAYESMPKDGPEREFIASVYKHIETRRASMVVSKVTHREED